MTGHYTLGDGWFCIGMSCTSVDNASGRHNKNMLVIVDEASGVGKHAWDALYSWKPKKLLVLGNPLNADGEFVELFNRSKDEEELKRPEHLRCVSYVISATDSPHRDMEESPCGLPDKTFLDDIAANRGRGSFYWITHIELDKTYPFPTSSHDQLIPTDWIDNCVAGARPNWIGDRVMAVDVAKGTGGDRTVFMVSDILGIVDVIQSNTTDIKTAASLVRQYCARYRVDPARVVYDAGGWAGSDMSRYLAEQHLRSCQKYYGGDPGGTRFTNRRSLVAWRVRNRLDPERPVIRPQPVYDPTLLSRPQPVPAPEAQPRFHADPKAPWWPELRECLVALRYSFDGKKTKLELKEEMAARLGYSPDVLDCLLMTASQWVDCD